MSFPVLALGTLAKSQVRGAWRNNRIAANAFLNQRCALAPNLEKIFRARMSKIVLQQYRHECEVPECSLHVRFLSAEQTQRGSPMVSP
jgi:hypothetical protein